MKRWDDYGLKKKNVLVIWTFAATFHYCPALQITAHSSHLGDSVYYAEIQVNQIDTSDSTMENKPPVWPTVRVVLKNILMSPCM